MHYRIFCFTLALCFFCDHLKAAGTATAPSSAQGGKIKLIQVKLTHQEFDNYQKETDQKAKDKVGMDAFLERLVKSYEQGQPLLVIGDLVQCKAALGDDKKAPKQKHCELKKEGITSLNSTSAMASSVYMFAQTQSEEIATKIVPVFFGKTLKTLENAQAEEAAIQEVVAFLAQKHYNPLSNKKLPVFAVPEAFIWIEHNDNLLNDIQILHRGRGKELAQYMDENKVDTEEFGETLWAFHETGRPTPEAVKDAPLDAKIYLDPVSETSYTAEKMENVFKKYISPAFMEDIENDRAAFKEALEGLPPALKKYFFAINHGDCHAKNVFFDSSKMNHFSFIDFGSMARDIKKGPSSFTNDITYLIYTYTFYWRHNMENAVPLHSKFLFGYLKNAPKEARKSLLALIKLTLNLRVFYTEFDRITKKSRKRSTLSADLQLAGEIIEATESLLDGHHETIPQYIKPEEKAASRIQSFLKNRKSPPSSLHS